jgi:hypothetical protein
VSYNTSILKIRGRPTTADYEQFAIPIVPPPADPEAEEGNRVFKTVGNKDVQMASKNDAELLGRWEKPIAVMLIVTATCLILLPPGSALADDPTASADSSEGTGIQVASWALTVPYAIGKGAFALGGAVVGGFGYVFSGGNFDTAKTIWTRSIYGTYLIRPAQLRGEEPVHFLGQADESPSESVSPPAKSTSGTHDSTTK